MEKKWLTCDVSPGQFPTEYAISGVQFNNKPFSLFAPANTVQPPVGGEGSGFVEVEVADRRGDLYLVRLPAQTFENGQYVTVKASDLHANVPSEQVKA